MSNIKKVFTGLFILLMAAIASLRVTGLINFSVVNGNSMLPNYQPNDYVVSSKIGMNQESLHQGDIIIVKSAENRMVIKRIIGLPGDTVEIVNGQVIVNGEELDEPYVYDENNDLLINRESVTLQDNEYYICGDNRLDSLDSRKYGPVKYEMIVGKLMFMIPLSNLVK